MTENYRFNIGNQGAAYQEELAGNADDERILISI
jgi:hypothetical protein